jgi:hypothetical protein
LWNAHLFTEYIHLELCPTTIHLAISTARLLLVRGLVAVAVALGATEDMVAPLQTHTAISLTCSGFNKTQRMQEHLPNSYTYAGRTTPIKVLAARGMEEVRDSNQLTSLMTSLSVSHEVIIVLCIQSVAHLELASNTGKQG